MAKKSTPAERRRSPRVRVAARVTWEDQTQFCFVENLSWHGMFIAFAGVPPQLGDSLRLELALPEGKPVVALHATVTRHQKTSPKGFAVDFKQLPLEAEILFADTFALPQKP